MSGLASHWRDSPLWLKTVIAGLLPAVTLLATALIGYRLHRDLHAAEADMDRALVIQSHIQALHILQAEAALGMRGYLLTARPEFLAPYERARRGTPAILEATRARIRDPVVQEQFRVVVALIDEEFERLEALRHHGGRADADERQRQLLESKQLLDRLRAALGDLHRREATLVARFTNTARRATELNYRFSIGAGLVILVSSVAALTVLLGGLLRRLRVLVRNAERLVHEQPLLDAPQGRDELGLLAARLDKAGRLLAERARQAQAASEAKTQILSRTSHEFRTPLHSIIGNAELLAQPAAPEVQAPRAQAVVAAGRHLLGLIDDILDIGRAAQGALRVDCAPLDVAAVLHQAVLLMQPVAQARPLTLVLLPLEGDAESDTTAEADRGRLLQVLLNLLSNAIKFSAPGGRVDAVLALTATQVQVRVRDSGPGIAADDGERVFEPLERLDAEARGIAGSGLGLSISRQLVQAMGGTLVLEAGGGPAPATGATFCLSLPRRAPSVNADAPAHTDQHADEAASQALWPASTAADAASAAVRVLGIALADDDAAVIEAVLARRAGHALLRVPDTPTALHVLAQGAWRCVLLAGSANARDLDVLDAALPARPGPRPVLAWLGADASVAARGVVALPRPLPIKTFTTLLEPRAP